MKKLSIQMILYGLVGVATLLIDVVVTYGLFNWLRFPAYLASGVGFLSGFFFSFPMNRKKVFHHTENDRFSFKNQVALYISLSLFNLLASSAAVDGLVGAGVFAIQYAKIVTTAVIAVWNFALFKLVIFSKKNQNAIHESNET